MYFDVEGSSTRRVTPSDNGFRRIIARQTPRSQGRHLHKHDITQVKINTYAYVTNCMWRVRRKFVGQWSSSILPTEPEARSRVYLFEP